MSYLVINDHNGERTVDLTLDRDQLRHLFTYLTGETLRYAKLWHSACNNPDPLMETAEQMRELERVAGEKIWPRLVNSAIND